MTYKFERLGKFYKGLTFAMVITGVTAVLLAWLLPVSIVWALFDRDKRFLHDRLARTRLAMC